MNPRKKPPSKRESRYRGKCLGNVADKEGQTQCVNSRLLEAGHAVRVRSRPYAPTPWYLYKDTSAMLVREWKGRFFQLKLQEIIMREMFEYLKAREILTKKGPNFKKLKKLNPAQTLNIVEKLVELGRQSSKIPTASQFTHFASLSLGGGKEACFNPACRINRLDSLMRFSLMYSDQVFIPNYFLDYDRYKKSGKISADSLATQFIADIITFAHMLPLVTAQKISIFTPQTHICPSCLAEMNFGKGASGRMERLSAELRKEYLSNSKVNLEFNNGEYRLGCSGPELYFEHGGGSIGFEKMPSLLAKNKKILEIARRHGAISLSKKMVEKIGAIDGFYVGNIVRNMWYEMAATQALHTSFLTDRDIDVLFLEKLTKKKDVLDNNKLALQYLTSEVPFLRDVALKDLIELRKHEEDAFVLYRHALNRAISEFKSAKQSLTAKDAKGIYSDILQPRLSKLDQTVKAAVHSLKVKPLRSALAAVGVISFGAFAGFLPAELKPLIQAFGATLGGTTFLKDLLAMKDGEDSIKSDNLYFLWRVKELSKKHKS